MTQPSLDDVEIWKPVPGWEGFYDVSSLGRIRSVPRPGGNNRMYGGHLIKLQFNDGYPYAGLSRKGGGRGERKVRPVHQMVLEAFVGPRPLGMEGCHNNGNPVDARVSNLRWDTPLANAHDKFRHGTIIEGDPAALRIRVALPGDADNTTRTGGHLRRGRQCDLRGHQWEDLEDRLSPRALARP